MIQVLRHLGEFKLNPSQQMNPLDLDPRPVMIVDQADHQEVESAQYEKVNKEVIHSSMVLLRFRNLLHNRGHLKIIYFYQKLLLGILLYFVIVVELVENNKGPHNDD